MFLFWQDRVLLKVLVGLCHSPDDWAMLLGSLQGDGLEPIGWTSSRPIHLIRSTIFIQKEIFTSLNILSSLEMIVEVKMEMSMP